MQRGGGAAPTGCFKCGRPGHWSRDCPSSSAAATAANPNPGSTSHSNIPQAPNKRPFPAKDKAIDAASSSNPAAGTKKAPRTRPKLTPDLLLSDDGLGYVLRHFPRSFKYHGHGHEVDDLGRLIDLYADWHSRLLPYYSFNQFVHKIEKVGATVRVRRCIEELRQRIANGGDLTKLHEPPTALVSNQEPEVDALQTGAQALDEVDTTFEKHNAVDIEEEMINEIYQKATEEPSQTLQQEPHQSLQCTVDSGENPERVFTQNRVTNSSAPEMSKIQITEEQRTRMEANRIKAIERAAERSRSLQVA